MTFERLIHGKVGRSGQTLLIGNPPRVEFEHLQEAIIATTNDPAIHAVPTQALQLDSIRNGNLFRQVDEHALSR